MQTELTFNHTQPEATLQAFNDFEGNWSTRPVTPLCVLLYWIEGDAPEHVWVHSVHANPAHAIDTAKRSAEEDVRNHFDVGETENFTYDFEPWELQDAEVLFWASGHGYCYSIQFANQA